MTLPRVAVVMPSYNQDAYIAAAVDSVLAQNYDNLQLIISDDASTDSTVAIIRDYCARYPGTITAQYHVHNCGVTANALSCYPLIDADYVCWFAADDIMLPGKLSAQVTALAAAPDAALCYHDVDVFDTATDRHLYDFNRETSLTPYSGDIAKQLIQHRCFIAGISAMLRWDGPDKLKHRNAAGVCSDWMLFIEYAMQGPVIYLPQVLARYRRHDHNITNDNVPKREEMVFNLVAQLYPAYTRDVNLGRGRFHLFMAVKTLCAGQLHLAGQQLIKLLGLCLTQPWVLPFVTGGFYEQLSWRLKRFYAKMTAQKNL